MVEKEKGKGEEEDKKTNQITPIFIKINITMTY